MGGPSPTTLHKRPRRAPRAAAIAAGLVACLAAGPSEAEVRAEMSGTQVELDATAAPLPEVLDRLARLTGMKLVFDASAPRPLVTLSVRGRSPAQTVLAVFEGLGINYALITDASGLQVQKLLVTGAAAPSSPSGRSPVPAFRPHRNMPVEPEPIEEPPLDEPPPDSFGIPGLEETAPPELPADASPEVAPEPSAEASPAPYIPGLALPMAPGEVQPLQPFPVPTPTAPPQGAPTGEVPPFSP